MSAKEKHSNEAETLTSCKVEDRECQLGESIASKQRHPHPGSKEQAIHQGRNKATKQRHLPTGEQRTGNVSWEKHSNEAKAFTIWKAENKQCQLRKSIATKQRHSHPGKQRTGNVNRGETEPSRVIHILESREQGMSTGEKQSNKVEKLTCWKAEDRQFHQGRNRATKQRHSQAEEQRTGNISWGKHSNQAEALTIWKAGDRQCQLRTSISTKQRLLHPKKQRQAMSTGEK